MFWFCLHNQSSSSKILLLHLLHKIGAIMPAYLSRMPTIIKMVFDTLYHNLWPTWYTRTTLCVYTYEYALYILRTRLEYKVLILSTILLMWNNIEHYNLFWKWKQRFLYKLMTNDHKRYSSTIVTKVKELRCAATYSEYMYSYCTV